MKRGIRSSLCGAIAALFFATSALADDIEGRIESIDATTQSFVVQGITFHATPATEIEKDD